MKYVRSNVRNACERMRLGVEVTEEQQPIVELVESLLPSQESWDTFGKSWDIVISSDDEIVVIKPEGDTLFVRDTCAQAKVLAEVDAAPNWTPRAKNVIDIVEAQWLEPKMSWKTYGVSWVVHVDVETKRITTKLVAERGQRKIEESELASPVSVRAEPPRTVELTASEATPEEVAAINRMLGLNNG